MTVKPYPLKVLQTIGISFYSNDHKIVGSLSYVLSRNKESFVKKVFDYRLPKDRRIISSRLFRKVSYVLN